MAKNEKQKMIDHINKHHRCTNNHATNKKHHKKDKPHGYSIPIASESGSLNQCVSRVGGDTMETSKPATLKLANGVQGKAKKSDVVVSGAPVACILRGTNLYTYGICNQLSLVLSTG